VSSSGHHLVIRPTSEQLQHAAGRPHHLDHLDEQLGQSAAAPLDPAPL